VMPLLLYKSKAFLLIDVTCCMQNVVRPQRHRLVTCLAGETNALLHQAFADSEPAG
jgi:hypothetical protein